MRERLEKELIDSVCKEIYEAIESAKEKSAKDLELKDGTFIKTEEEDNRDLMMVSDGELQSLKDYVQYLAFDVINTYASVKNREITREGSLIDFKILVLDSVSNALAATRKS